MSKMELRSSRSRSRTPFLVQEQTESESMAAGNHVEQTVVRTTRRTTIVKSNESASSSTDEVNTSRETRSGRKSLSTSGAKSLRNRVLKTSDYSSEDGENEVSSSKTVRQNQRNQLTEDAKIVQNSGAEMPALELYRRSRRYWDEYPKTDWTYSQHSKDRVEIAPGVVAMPNMSRKTIHELNESGVNHLDSSHSFYSENVAHKNINTENSYTARHLSNLNDKALNSQTKRSYEEYNVKRRTITKWRSFKQVITSLFTTIFTVFYSTFRYSYKVQTSIFSQIHKAASKVMLWDTYLLWKTRPGQKAKKLILLCLLPLLLLGSIHLYLASGSTLALSCHPNCGKMASAIFYSYFESVYGIFQFNSTVK